MSNPSRPHLIALGLYTLLALGLTWPLATHLASHVPGEATWAFDESTFLWNMGWFKYSLLHLHQTPLQSCYIFFPLCIHLTTYTFNLFNAAFALPLQLALALPLASNLTLLFSYISSAYGTFLLSLYLLHQPNATPPSPLTPQSSTSNLQPPTFNLQPSHPKTQNPKPKTRNSFAAFAAGAVFAFSASRMMYLALGHYNFVTIQWFPFYTLFLLKTLREGRLKTIWLAGLFAALSLYAELTFSVFLLFITGLVVAGEWARERNTKGQGSMTWLKPRLGRLALLGLITFILTAPFILAVLPDFLDPAYAEPGWGEGLKLSADLAGLFTLTPLHPLSGVDWLRELRAVIEGTSRFSDANTLFLGYGILTLALLGYLTHRSEGRIWLWSGLVFILLSLGPLLTINGRNRFNLDGLEVTFPLPFALLHYIPLINANRVPNRFGIPLTLALAVLVGYAVAWLSEEVRRQRGEEAKRGKSEERGRRRGEEGGRRGEGEADQQIPRPLVSRFTLHASRFTFHVSRLLASLFLLTLLLFDQYSVPLPLTDARIPAVYEQIGAEPESFTLLQLPLGWRNSYGALGAEQTQLQYYQTAHHRPMLGGNTSRNPAFKFDYYAQIPLFAALTEVELYRSVDEVTLQRARHQAAELMTLYNIKYLVIHEPIPHRKPYEDTFTATRRLALELIPHQAEPVYQSPGVQAFAVQPANLPEPLLLDFGDWTSDPYRGDGWAGNEEIFAATANWATATEAFIFFPVHGSGDRQLTLQLAPFFYPGMPEQTLRLSLNGRLLAHSFSLREGWQTVETTLLEANLLDGLNRLSLHFTHTAQPRQVLPANMAIGQTGVAAPVDLEINSAQDFAFMTVDFGETAVDASTHRRGINVAVIQPQSGQLLGQRGFDTAANEFEAAALSQFIAQIPAGQIVMLASQGLDAAAFWQAETLASLQSLGLAAEALQPPFAAIGVKGAPAGTVLQVTGSQENTAYLRLGAVPDTRLLAAAVDKVTISTQVRKEK